MKSELDMETDQVEKNKSAGGVYIPEDIIQDILLRLPVKSLARFRCVSKPWLFFISSYKFSKAHLKFSRKNNVFINDKLVFGHKKLPVDFYTCSTQSIIEGFKVYPKTNDNLVIDRTEFNCPFVGAVDGILLVDSCNGLVCVQLLDEIILLWNPTTRETKRLPYSGTDREWLPEFIFSFAFGYDELHDDYKVVELSWRDGAIEVEVVMVYSLRTNTWKSLLNWPGGRIFKGMGKFVNGAVHWLVGDERGSPDDELVIVSLDLATNTFTEFTLPTADVRVEVDNLEGRLALYCKSNSDHLDVWVMIEYGASKSWAKVFQIPFFLSFWEYPRPLLISGDGKELVDYRKGLGMFDLNNPLSHRTFWVEATKYCESLISPCLDNKVIIGRTMPQEIITQILLRLPVKSLMRFKSVSKGWLSYISSSRFVKAYLKTSKTKNNVKLIFGHTAIGKCLYTCSINYHFGNSVGDEYRTLDRVLFDSPVVSPGAENAHEIRIVGSCNGLVCLTSSSNIILVNPATKKLRKLPNSSLEKTNSENYAVSYSFGYDEVHGDYKIVVFINFEHQTNMFKPYVEVYSMRTNSWKALLNWPGGNTCGSLGKCLNGSIHWLVRGFFDGSDKRVLVSHDLATDTFVQLPLPNIDSDIDDATVIILGGCLGLYCTHHNNVDVWLMKEYGVRESWARVVRIPFFMDLGHFVTPCPVFLWGDGMMLMNYGSSLKIIDLCNPQPRQLDPDHKVVTQTYVESLVSLTIDEDMIN